MKTKSLSLLASVALFAFVSCTDGMPEMDCQQSELLKKIVMTTEDFQPEAGSRTLYDISGGMVTCTWAANDTVGVFPDKGGQVYFPMTSGAGTKNATFDGEGWALKDGRTYAAYYPCIGEFYLDRHAVPVSYEGQTQVGDGSMAHLGAYDYMVAAPVAPEFGSAQFMFKHLSSLVQLKLTVAQPVVLKSVTLTTGTKAFAVEGKVDIMADTPRISPVTSVQGVKLDLQNVETTEANQEVILYLMLPPADLSNESLKAVITLDKGVEEVSLESKNFRAGTAYTLSASCKGLIVGDGTYKDGVVSLSEAGTMEKLLGSDCLNVSSLKVVGPINGDDVAVLRRMSGDWNVSEDKWGKLTTLDLSDATIVEGGGSYSYPDKTSDNIIGTYMFAGCTLLQDIVLPENITSIADEAFLSCTALKSITVPDRVTTIGKDAFYCCESMTFAVIGEGVATIDDEAFYGCKSLKSVEIPEGLSTLGKFAFYGCSSLTSIALPDGLKSIESYTFGKCSALKTVTIPHGVTKIGNNAFSDCSSLSSIDIPEGVTSISERTFLGCSSLTSVHIPSGVTSIDCYAFYQCSSLKSVYITNLAAWCRIDFNCEKGSNPLSNGAKLYLNNKLFTELAIPEGITEVKKLAFDGCTSITRATIDADVISIGESAFNNCSSLSSVIIGDGVTSIGGFAFSYCNSLVSVSIGDGIQTISGRAFYNCASLSSLSLGKNVTSIGDAAFMHSRITECYCYSTIPPGFNSTNSNPTFVYVQSGATLYVPSGCISRYKDSAWSKYFKNITTKY